MQRMKLFSTVVGLAVVLGAAGVAGAKGAKGNKAGGKHHGVSGKITSVDAANKQFTLTTGGKKSGNTVTVTVGSASIMVQGKVGSIDELKTGDRVTIQPDASNPTRIVDKGQGKGNKGKKTGA